MSLFIGMLAFAADPVLQDAVKVGILGGSLLSGLAGWAVLLRVAPREVPAPASASRAGRPPRSQQSGP
jgi:NhaA family Na+:H+ antiporter